MRAGQIQDVSIDFPSLHRPRRRIITNVFRKHVHPTFRPIGIFQKQMFQRQQHSLQLNSGDQRISRGLEQTDLNENISSGRKLKSLSPKPYPPSLQSNNLEDNLTAQLLNCNSFPLSMMLIAQNLGQQL